MAAADTGSAGEFRVDELMAALRWKRLGALGGSQRGIDGVWENADGHRVALAIRTMQGKRQWRDLAPGQVEHARQAAAEWKAACLFVGVSLTESSVDWAAGKAVAGDVEFVGACTLDAMIRAAADGRDWYCKTVITRGKNKGKFGEAKNCAYAICDEDLEGLETVLSRILKQSQG